MEILDELNHHLAVNLQPLGCFPRTLLGSASGSRLREEIFLSLFLCDFYFGEDQNDLKLNSLHTQLTHHYFPIFLVPCHFIGSPDLAEAAAAHNEGDDPGVAP